MIRTLALMISFWALTTPAHAQDGLLPSIGPALTTAQPAECNAPCEQTAALHRNILAVSRITPLAPAGEVAIYTRQEGTWNETALIASPGPCVAPPTPPGEDPVPCSDPVFGLDLALRGSYLFASVEPTSEQPGAVHVLRLVDDEWQPLQKLQFHADGLVPQSLQVSAIEAGARTLAVGISFVAVVDGVSRSSTAVHVFERTNSGRYRRAAVLSPADAQGTDFGSALAIRGDTLVVGAPSAANSTGAAYVFHRGQQGWRLNQKLSPSLPGAQSFGRAVAVSHGTIAIGAPSYFDTIDVSGGLVYLYQSPSGSWQETEVLRDPLTLEEPSQTNRRFFGTTLALQGARLMVGVGAGRPVPEEQPLTLLFQQTTAGWQPAAGFSPHVLPVRTQLSRDTALIVGAELRFGNQTYVYDLPTS
jgi:hypothetical protein